MKADDGKLKENKKCSAEETVRRALRRIADFDYKHPKSIIFCCLALFLIGVIYTAGHLTFDADQANLIKRSSGLQSNQDRYVENFPRAEDLVVVVEDGSKEDRREYVEALAKRLKEEPETFSDIFYKIDSSYLRTYVLHYLDNDDLRKTAEGLENNRLLISRLLKSQNLVDVMEATNVGRTAMDPDSLGRLLPVINGFADIFYDCMQQRGRLNNKTPWSEVLMGKEFTDEEREMFNELLTFGDMQRYSSISNGRFYILLCRPTYSDKEPFEVSAQKSVARMREILDELSRTHRKVFVGLTGEVVLNADEAESSSNDSVNSALLSLFLISVVFSWAFRDYWRPLMAVFGLVMGLGWTMGFTTLAIGHLNLLTVTFTTILMGLGIDFGIHIIYRYDEERQKTTSALEAMRTTLIGAGYENLTGAVSTALAFYVLAFTDFTGIAELGIIAGTGILLCLISMSLVLPSLIFLYERKHRFKSKANSSKYRYLVSAERWLLKNNDAVVACGIALTLICLWYAHYVRYDYNLLHLQAKGLESVSVERRLLNSSQHSLLCGIALAEDADKACRLAEKFEQLPSVSHVETAAFMIPQDYRHKAENLRRIVECVKKLPDVYGKIVHDPDVSRIKEFKELEGYFTEHGQDTEDFIKALSQSEDKEVRDQAVRLKKKMSALFAMMEKMGPGAIEEGLDRFEDILIDNLRGLVRFLKMQVWEPQFTVDSLPRDLKVREVGRKGLIQVRIFPKEDVWEREAQERFVKELESVDPNVVGMPVMAYYDCQELRTSNEKAGMWALIAIWILLFAHFRRIGTAVLALLPKVLGIIWMVGLMGALGIDFNSANFLALPLILGIGLVFGIHILHRVSEEGDHQGIFGHSTGPSITLAALTTMIGFATMIWADHQGIASLGMVMTLGVGANLVSSAIFMPSFFAFINKHFGYKVRLHK